MRTKYNAAFAKRIAVTGGTASGEKYTAIEFKKFTEFTRGTLYDKTNNDYC